LCALSNDDDDDDDDDITAAPSKLRCNSENDFLVGFNGTSQLTELIGRNDMTLQDHHQ